MKRLEPELKQIKKDFPNKEEQAKKTFELYKKYGTSPFSGCLVVLLQLPVIFALYYVFYRGITLSTGPLYPFLQAPSNLHTMFLGAIDVHTKSITLAFLAGLSQFIQGYLASPIKNKKEKNSTEQKTFQEQMADSMQMNVKYFLPIFVALIAYRISAAVALYWITSNIFTIAQEWYIRKKLAQNPI